MSRSVLRRLEDGLSTRTLMVWSRKDPSALFETIGLSLWNRLCENNRDVELHVFNEAGHYSYREYADDEFNRLLASFCSPHTKR